LANFFQEPFILIKRTVIVIAVTLLMSVSSAGLAQRVPEIQPPQLDISNNPRNARQVETPAPSISQRQAIELARQQFPGNILRITLIGQGNAIRYQIRMENEGKIFTVFVNANTGAVSGGPN
jgi:uncharacterized membrane protein YkoI